MRDVDLLTPVIFIQTSDSGVERTAVPPAGHRSLCLPVHEERRFDVLRQRRRGRPGKVYFFTRDFYFFGLPECATYWNGYFSSFLLEFTAFRQN